MKCPLFILNDLRVQSGEETGIGDCLKEECAWWHRESSRCSFATLAQGITYLHKVLLDIETSTPHEE